MMDAAGRRAHRLEIFKTFLERLVMENRWDVIERLMNQLDPLKRCAVQENDSVPHL